jgi:hypothetical protein
MYNRQKAIEYAEKWANGRNPKYYNFDKLGGDCTNFISQCLYAGCGKMDYSKPDGWYYSSLNNRAAAWTSVEFLYKFLTTKNSNVLSGTKIMLDKLKPGDIIQISFDGAVWAHTLLVTKTSPEILICAHTDDSKDRPLNSYNYKALRALSIE